MFLLCRNWYFFVRHVFYFLSSTNLRRQHRALLLPPPACHSTNGPPRNKTKISGNRTTPSAPTRPPTNKTKIPITWTKSWTTIGTDGIRLCWHMFCLFELPNKTCKQNKMQEGMVVWARCLCCSHLAHMTLVPSCIFVCALCLVFLSIFSGGIYHLNTAFEWLSQHTWRSSPFWFHSNTQRLNDMGKGMSARILSCINVGWISCIEMLLFQCRLNPGMFTRKGRNSPILLESH